MSDLKPTLIDWLVACLIQAEHIHGYIQPWQTERHTKCQYCGDPVCLDDFITGECPVEECIEDCGCVVLRDTKTSDVLEVVEHCWQCGMELEMYKSENEQFYFERRNKF